MNDGAFGTIRAQQRFKEMPDYGLDKVADVQVDLSGIVNLIVCTAVDDWHPRRQQQHRFLAPS